MNLYAKKRPADYDFTDARKITTGITLLVAVPLLLCVVISMCKGSWFAAATFAFPLASVCLVRWGMIALFEIARHGAEIRDALERLPQPQNSTAKPERPPASDGRMVYDPATHDYVRR